MRVIIGLGNPERDYKNTRHNMGFETVNKLAYDHDISLNRAKFRAHFGEGQISGKKVLLVKPQTFMNLSGESVRELLAYYKLGAADILVIYDDTDLDLGQVRIRERGTAGGHNGIKNIIYHLETTEFDRVRLGIGAKPNGWDLADYVTSRFKPEEFESMVEAVTRGAAAVEMILKDGMASAMNQFNSATYENGGARTRG